MDDITCKADTRRRLIGGDAPALTPLALLDAVLPRREASQAVAVLEVTLSRLTDLGATRILAPPQQGHRRANLLPS